MQVRRPVARVAAARPEAAVRDPRDGRRWRRKRRSGSALQACRRLRRTQGVQRQRRAFRLSGLIGAAQEMSLFARAQLIEIRIPSGKPAGRSEALQRYVEHLSPDVLTLVQLPRLDGQQTKSAWFARTRPGHVRSSRRATRCRPDRAAAGAAGAACGGGRGRLAHAGLLIVSRATRWPRTRRCEAGAGPGASWFRQVEAAVLNVAP